MCCDRLVGAFAWVSVMACLTYCLAAYHPWAFVPLLEVISIKTDYFPREILLLTKDPLCFF